MSDKITAENKIPSVRPDPQKRIIPEKQLYSEADILFEQLEKEQFKGGFDSLCAIVLVGMTLFLTLFLFVADSKLFGEGNALPEFSLSALVSGDYTGELGELVLEGSPFDKLGSYAEYGMSFIYGFDSNRKPPEFDEEIPPVDSVPDDSSSSMPDETTTTAATTAPTETTTTTTRPFETVTGDDGNIYTGYTGATTTTVMTDIGGNIITVITDESGNVVTVMTDSEGNAITVVTDVEGNIVTDIEGNIVTTVTPSTAITEETTEVTTEPEFVMSVVTDANGKIVGLVIDAEGNIVSVVTDTDGNPSVDENGNIITEQTRTQPSYVIITAPSTTTTEATTTQPPEEITDAPQTVPSVNTEDTSDIPEEE